MSRTSIFACVDARESHWQLGPLPPKTGRFALIGWKASTDAAVDIEAGVPEAVAPVLARAFTSIARVMFLTDPARLDGWTLLEGDQVSKLPIKSVATRITARLRGAPSSIALVSTRHADTAMRLFDDAGFPWWQQGQVVLLVEPQPAQCDVALEVFDTETLLGLFDEDWTMRAASLTATGVMGVVRPGVDGDVAGLFSLTEGFLHPALEALARQTRLAGFEWAVVPEKEFAVG